MALAEQPSPNPKSDAGRTAPGMLDPQAGMAPDLHGWMHRLS
jgi:hypothetical protein